MLAKLAAVLVAVAALLAAPASVRDQATPTPAPAESKSADVQAMGDAPQPAATPTGDLTCIQTVYVGYTRSCGAWGYIAHPTPAAPAQEGYPAP